MILEKLDQLHLGDKQIKAVALLDRSTYLGVSWNGTLAKRDYRSRQTREVVVDNGVPCSSMAISAAEGIAVTTFTGDVHLFDSAKLDQRLSVRLSQSPLTCAAVSGPQDIFAFGGRLREIVCARATDLSVICRLDGHRDWVESLAFAPKSPVLAAGDQAGEIRLWSIARQKQLSLLEGHRGAVMALAWSPDGLLIASGGQDNIIRLWNPADGAPVGNLTGHTSTIRGLFFFSGNDSLISVSQDRTIRFWNIGSRTQSDSFTTDQQWLTCLAADENNRLLLTGSLTGYVSLMSF